MSAIKQAQKHTPGPFRGGKEAINDAEGRLLATVHFKGVSDTDISVEEGHANSHLFAAAPDLYEALKALTENIGNVGAHNCPGFDCARCQSPDVGWALAHEAIAKAEGK